MWAATDLTGRFMGVVAGVLLRIVLGLCDLVLDCDLCVCDKVLGPPTIVGTVPGARSEAQRGMWAVALARWHPPAVGAWA